jgi:alkanesulfonate monooxygenase SsuD/methylene tetrahydromethanopterin reductase-like flavin-dependent oxidoreductase (luciferase family)
MDVRAAPSSALDWGIAGASLTGERTSGDLHLILPSPRGALVAVVDGVGHGPEAARVATRAIDAIRTRPEESVTALMRACHQELAGSRGAVVGIAAFDVLDSTLSWICVGNIEGALIRAEDAAHPRVDRFLSRRGVVGHQLPMLQASTTATAPGDLLVIATDGIAPGFAEHVVPGHPQAVADAILQACRKGTDDALVVVGRYRGGAA